MLNMLPKLALVAMKTYFRVLAKVMRPSCTPCTRTSRSLLQQDDVGRLLGHVHGAVHRDAHVGGMQGRGVVDPVAHDSPPRCRPVFRARMIRSFWLGSTSAKMSTSWARCRRASSLIWRISWPGEDGRCWPAPPGGRWCRRQAVVAGDDLQGDPQVGQPVDGLGDARLGRVVDDQETQKGHARLIVLADVRDRPHVPVGDAQSAPALLAEPPSPVLDLGVTWSSGRWWRQSAVSAAVQTASTLGNAPLVIITPARPRGHQNTQALADKVVGHFIQLLGSR